MATAIEPIGKLDVARRQVAEAIRMFFERRDPVAVHTLIYAAHQILTDLCTARRLDTILKNNPLLKPERAREWHQAMNEAGNFLKHADKDPDATLEFRPKLTEGFIFEKGLL